MKQAFLSISAMHNKNNKGTVYFGINNEGKVVGQQIGKETTKDISMEIKNHFKPIISPTIEIIDINDKKIIKVEVEGEYTPYSTYGRYYIRTDDEDNEMTNLQLED